jgi:hypothetical protein
MKLVDNSGRKKVYLKEKLMKLKLTVRSKISEACVGAKMTLSGITNLDLM